MKVTKLRHRTRDVEHVAGAAEIDAQRQIASNGEIVNCGQMKDSRCLLSDKLQIRRHSSASSGSADVTFNNLKVASTLARELSNSTNLFVRTRHQRRLNQQNETGTLCAPDVPANDSQ